MLMQVVLEGQHVNLDVTSPGATLALGLMFLRTNDAAIAASFAIPDTAFALDYVRPDLILLRLLARSLVLWDSIRPTADWIASQLPPLLQVRQLPSLHCLNAGHMAVRKSCKTVVRCSVIHHLRCTACKP